MRFIYTHCNEENFKYVRYVRDSVFIDEQCISADEESDEYDSNPSTDFIVLMDGDRAVATARIAHRQHDDKIGRVAVLQEYRGQHLGAKIVSEAVRKVFADGKTSAYLESQKYAVGFYETLGFEICGGELIDRGIIHLPMTVTTKSFKGV